MVALGMLIKSSPSTVLTPLSLRIAFFCGIMLPVVYRRSTATLGAFGSFSSFMSIEAQALKLNSAVMQNRDFVMIFTFLEMVFRIQR